MDDQEERAPRVEALQVVEPRSGVLSRVPGLAQSAKTYAEASEADNTKRARKADWGVFERWCAANQAEALPATAETVIGFLTDCSSGGKAVATLRRYLYSIGAIHRLRGHADPAAVEIVKKVMSGIGRTRGVAQKQKEALTADLLLQIVERYGSSPSDARDRAILLLGLVGAMRRSEICALDVEDVRRVEDGVLITIRRSKTDQDGKGRGIAIAKLDSLPELCPVRALDAWLSVTGRTRGPLFVGFLGKTGKLRDTHLSSQCVGDIVKEAVIKIGLDPKLFGGHSLRAGYVTTARKRGVDWGSIMEQTGHRRLETVKLYARYTPDLFQATRVRDIFDKEEK